MCLGVPGKVIEVDGPVALVDFWGVRKLIRLDVVDEPVAPGDYVLNHVGFAIRRIAAEEIGETLALYDELLRRASVDDLMAADVRGELQAAAAHDRTGSTAAGWPRRVEAELAVGGGGDDQC